MTSLGKAMPQNIEAEEAILGGILLDPEAISRVLEMLQPKYFALPSHQTIYRGMVELHQQGKPTDLMTVTTWLGDRDLLEKVGGQTKIATLVERTISAVNIDQYAALVVDKFLRRKLIEAGNEIVEIGYETATELETVLDSAEKKVFSLTQERPQQELVSISETLVNTFQDIEDRNEGVALPGIPCGFYDLDAMTGGFQRSDLIIVAGRPSMGKCCAHDTLILQEDGSLETIEAIYQKRRAKLFTLGENWQFKITEPSGFVDDGIKPVFRVTTKLGRFVETTITHPFLTISGWEKLSDLKPGNKIAVPLNLDVFGTETIPEHQVKLLGYLIGDGDLTDTMPKFKNINPQIQADFIEAVSCFFGVKIKTVPGKEGGKFYGVVKDFKKVSIYRKSFAERLEMAIESEFPSTQKLAKQLGVKTTLISHWKESKSVPNYETFKQLCELLKVQPEELAPHGIILMKRSSESPIILWLQEAGLWGKEDRDKTIPAVVFQLNKSELSLFINRLFSTDGWAAFLKGDRSVLSYCTLNETLAIQLQHLLLRFGIIATKKSVESDNTPRLVWQLDITDPKSVLTFINEIGIFGKEEALAKIKEALSGGNYETNRNLIPIEMLKYLAKIKGDESGSEDYLRLEQLANSDVYWDEIISIEPAGEKQVYDLTVPETGNFVANDICVHNTSFAINIAHNIAMTQKLPIAIFSLEMSKEQLVQRLLASEAKIESNRLRAGRISQNEWEPLIQAIATLSEQPIFIDDTPNITVNEMRSKARRLQTENGGALGLILLDYLQLMEGSGSDNRVQELSRITRSLKGLARELSVPIISLSQLSRSVETRTNKRPMMSDLRESGSIEQDADLVIMLYREEYYNPDTPDRGIAEVIITKHRNGPVGTIKLLFDSQFTRFRNLATSRG